MKEQLTRTEELCKHAHEICNNPQLDNKSTEDLCYIAMKWADRTMIDKACEWLRKELAGYIHAEYVAEEQTIDGYISYDMIKDFIKAMEGAK